MDQAQLPLDEKALSRERVVSFLSTRHCGAGHGVSCAGMVQSLLGHPDKAAERQLRTMITELRLQGVPICGTPSTGYFMARSPEELEKTRKHLYQRSMTGLRQVAALGRRAMPDLAGQLGIGNAPE